ncbi:hypothetical protein [Micromonospora narathiwatensis]|uniref:hypothetical protein n=1 Tax=Micromonospora narathiwatensis TaxID=299146 RepID=UPI0014304744|nr:hypothetical protein [Micromonospora narathiwatensis]
MNRERWADQQHNHTLKPTPRSNHPITGRLETGPRIEAKVVLAERVGWCADLVAGMVGVLVGEHWNAVDVEVLASGLDTGGRRLPSHAWMALRRLGWTATTPKGVKVNDRVVRMAQEQAGRALRSVKWRADLTTGVLASWPAEPGRRTAREWEQVRQAVPGGEHLPSSVIKGRTRQAATFLNAYGRLPMDVFELEGVPRIPRMLLLAACDRQQATIERSEADPGRVLLRLQLPSRPDPRTYRDWTWVACPITLPPTVPACAVLHLPTLRVTGGKVHADMAYSHAVPKARRNGHTVALGVDWGSTPCCPPEPCDWEPTDGSRRWGLVDSSAPPESSPNSTACAATASGCTPRPTTTSGSSASTSGLNSSASRRYCATRSGTCPSAART